MSRIQFCFGAAVVAAVLAAPPASAEPSASAEPCTVTKEFIQAKLEGGSTPEELYAQFGDCVASDPGTAPPGICTEKANEVPPNEAELFGMPDAPSAINPWTPPTQVITNIGSVYYEALTSCGYHPQAKSGACAVEIRQRFGFGGPPGAPGSREYVLFCVDLGAGLVPISIGSFNVHDEAFGVPPRWYFATLMPANQALAARPLNGTTYGARAILSWAIPPQVCNFRPWWGNQIDFRIRLDP